MRASVTGIALSFALVIVACASEPAPTGVPATGAGTELLGPLAVVTSFNGDMARSEGRLDIGVACVYLVHADGSRTFLVWPSGQVHWDEATNTITYANHDGAVHTYHHGDLIAVGGSGGSAVEEPPLQARHLAWVAPPSPECDTSNFWLLGDVSAI